MPSQARQALLGEERKTKGGDTLMKRFIALGTAAILAAALISQWHRVKVLSRQLLGGGEEPASEDPGPASQPAGGGDDATRRVDQPTGEAGEPKSGWKPLPPPSAERKRWGWTSRRWKAQVPEGASRSKT